MAIRRLTNSLLALTLLFLCSCGKDDDTTAPAETYLEGTNWVPGRVKQLEEHIYLDETYHVVYVVNYPAPDVGHAASEGHRAWYFNFDTHQAVDSTAAVDGLATWHIMFNSIYNSQINADAATAEGKNGLGKIRVIRTAFDELSAAPADSMIRNSVPISFDMNDIIDSWGYYQFSDHSLVPYKGRSLIFLLKDRRYVKLELVNLYKDNPVTAPDYKDPNTKNLAPYFNFRYYVQETPGSLDLKTK
jgi:hypothetical protein